jgi:hypothetical protein
MLNLGRFCKRQGENVDARTAGLPFALNAGAAEWFP